MAEGDPRPSEVGHLLQTPIEQVVSKPLSFSAIVQGKTQLTIGQKDVLECYNFTDPSSITIKTPSDHHGKPSINFTISEKLQMVEKLKWVLVGKFSHGRPPLAVIKAFFQDVKLQGDVNFAFADSKHIFIECFGYLDYYFIWMHLVWNIHGYDMRIFKWNSHFSVLVESPIAPVWIRIEGLALYLFDEITLLSIASTLGKPIKVDPRNVNHSCLSSARICIELDVSKPLIDAIWISIVDEKTGAHTEGMRAHVFYDVVPDFCSECSHIGHQAAKCKGKKQSSSGAHSSGLSHSTIPTTVVHWQGVQNRHVKVWKQVGIRQTAQVGSTEFMAHEGQGVQVGESTCSPITPHSGSQQIREANLKGQEQIPAYKSSNSDEVPNWSQNSFHSLQLEEKAFSKVDIDADVPIDKAGHITQQDLAQLPSPKPAMTVLSEHKQETVAPSCTVLAGATDHLAACESSAHSAQDIAGQLSDVALQQSSGANQVHDQIGCFQELSMQDQLDATKRHQLSKNGAAVVPAAKRNGAHPKYADSTQTQDQINEQTTVHQLENQPTQHSQQPATFEAQQARFLRPSWADQVEEEKEQSTLQTAQKTSLLSQQMEATHTSAQDQVTTNSRNKDHYMALEHNFELHTEKEEGASGNFIYVHIPDFYDLSPQEQKDDAAIIMADFYMYFVRTALEEEIEKDSKDNRAAPDSEQLPTEQEWKTVTGKKKRTIKVKADQKGYQSHQMVDTRIESLCARINKMKRDCPAKRKLLAELEDLNQLHLEDGV